MASVTADQLRVAPEEEIPEAERLETVGQLVVKVDWVYPAVSAEQVLCTLQS